jgi:hypothetical protein
MGLGALAGIGEWSGSVKDFLSRQHFDAMALAFSNVLKWLEIDLPKRFSEFGANLIGGSVEGIQVKAVEVKDAVVNLRAIAL